MNTNFNNLTYDGREVSNETINWEDVKIGDVVIQGFLSKEKCEYITLTNIDGKYWEYFENGYYKSTSPEFCHWLIKGQKNCDGKIIHINYKR